jgi:hypothetical protein
MSDTLPPPDLGIENEDDVHVMPTFGPEHACSAQCWCAPELDYTDADTGVSVWVHRVMN